MIELKGPQKTLSPAFTDEPPIALGPFKPTYESLKAYKGVFSLAVNAFSQEIISKERQYKADLGNGYYLNPIFKGDYGDPTLFRDGNDYYITHHSSPVNGQSMLIWHSKDLVNWEPVCYAVKEDLGGPIWAVDFLKYKDLYYMYLPVPARGTNYVITAPSPSGPWSKPIDLKVSGIDPGHIATPEGKRFLHVDNGYVVELADDGLSVLTPKKKVYEGWKYPEQWIAECFCMESPKLTYHNGYYYLTVAEGGTAGPPTSHMVVSARSKNPDGPWENSPFNPIVRNTSRTNQWWSTGHGTLVDSPDGKWWIVFHGYEKDYRNMGRQTLMLPIEWTSDGWYRVPKDVDIAKPIKKPIGTDIKSRLHLSNDFSGDKLDIFWDTYRGEESDRIQLKDNSMIMKAQGTSTINSRPILFKPLNNSYEVDVEVNTGEKSKGGILLHYSTTSSLGMELEKNTIYRLTGGVGRTKVTDVKPGDHVYLKVANDHQDALYFYSFDRKTWKRVDFVNNLNDFGKGTLRIGLYAAGEGEVTFKNFTYKGLPAENQAQVSESGKKVPGTVSETAEKRTYTNPVGASPIHIGDPLVIRNNGKYYL